MTRAVLLLLPKRLAHPCRRHTTVTSVVTTASSNVRSTTAAQERRFDELRLRKCASSLRCCGHGYRSLRRATALTFVPTQSSGRSSTPCVRPQASIRWLPARCAVLAHADPVSSSIPWDCFAPCTHNTNTLRLLSLASHALLLLAGHVERAPGIWRLLLRARRSAT
jgi:hypothetical protein